MKMAAEKANIFNLIYACEQPLLTVAVFLPMAGFRLLSGRDVSHPNQN